MKFQAKTLEDTKFLAEAFASLVDDKGLFVTLTGDIGAGKTQFIRYVLNAIGVKEKITSPSFVILNEYKTKKFPIYHFDLYRLEEKGLSSIIEELRQYSKEGFLTFIERAQFGQNEIPNNAIKINVEYDSDNVDIRWYEFISDENFDFIKKLDKKVKE